MHDLRTAKILMLAALGMVLVLTTTFSTAAFTSSSTSTATVRAAADWTPPQAALGVHAPLVKGVVTLTATASDADSGLGQVAIQRRMTGAGLWQTICERSSSPVSCTWSTTGAPDGEYELQAVATDKDGNRSLQATRTTVTVDNTAPTVTMKDPGSPLTGTRSFEATGVADAASGVARVDIQYALGSGAWRDLCSVLAPTPTWSCTYGTTALANGSYSFRAVATDAAGNTATSTTVTGRQVDNTAPTVSLKDPMGGAVLAGSVTLEATASAPAGVTSVRFEHAPSGTTAWSLIGTDLSAPYSLDWSTTTVANGLYDLRAVLVDGSGATTPSPVVTGRRVDNVVLPAPVGLDVQAVNGGSQQGLIEPGDIITFTYAGQLDLATVLPGWAGGSTRVTFRLTDVAEVETVQVVGANLGTVALNGDYSKKDRVLDVGSTMTAATASAGGQVRTTVTVTLGALSSGYNGTLETVRTGTTLTWTPSTLARDVLGRPVPATMVTELGPADVDF